MIRSLIAIISSSLLVGATLGYSFASDKETPATFSAEWKCTKRDVYYTKKTMEKLCKQWTRIN